MTHLVPIPPPAGYQVPTMTTFSVNAPDGVGFIAAWGLIPGTVWRVGTDFEPEVVSSYELGPSPGADLWKFKLKGVRVGQKLAAFKYDATAKNWQRYSEYVTVTVNTGDTFANGVLPKCVHNAKISYYPFGATHSCPPMAEPAWKNAIENAMNQLVA